MARLPGLDELHARQYHPLPSDVKMKRSLPALPVHNPGMRSAPPHGLGPRCTICDPGRTSPFLPRMRGPGGRRCEDAPIHQLKMQRRARGRTSLTDWFSAGSPVVARKGPQGAGVVGRGALGALGAAAPVRASSIARSALASGLVQMGSLLLRLGLARVATVGFAGAGGLSGYVYSTDEGFRRQVKLYSQIGPIIAHYRFLEAKFKALGSERAQRDLEYGVLHQRYAPQVLKSLQELKGFYIKIGQIAAGRNDLFPDNYIELLRTLENEVPPEGTEVVKDTIRDSLGLKNLEDIFDEFDERPLGSASIGQVHRARLKKTGKEVAVKVQYPGVESLFRSDLKIIRGFCDIFAPEHKVVLDEIEKQFLTEFDYRLEAEQLSQVKMNLRKFNREVEVPKPHAELCTKHVLVMQYLPGEKLLDGVRAVGRKFAAKKGTTLEAMEKEVKERILAEGLPPPYDGPSATTLALYRNWIKVKTGVANAILRVLNGLIFIGTLGLCPRFSLLDPVIPLNSARIMDTLLRVHGHELLEDGYLNGDPHAGNFLLLSDGRLGLIDMGQIKRLTEQERYNIAEYLVCMMRGDRAELKRLAIKGGYKSRNFDEEVIWKMTTFGLDQDGRNVTDGLNFQQFLDKMYKQDPWSKTSDAIIIPCRVSVMLRGIGLTLNHPVSVLKVWGPIAEKVLRELDGKKKAGYQLSHDLPFTLGEAG
eukprot:scaffold1786_cov398-Prasinococcus_capsulatus_cf.AAC.38